MASPGLSTEMKHIYLQRQQLHERRKILCIFQELRERAEFGQTEEAAATQAEINQIDQKLKELEEMETEHKRTYENVLYAHGIKVKQGISEPALSTNPNHYDNICYIEPPPSHPAPSVVLDVANLPPYSCKTQCPECKQFVITETTSSVSSVTWLACIITVMLGYEPLSPVLIKYLPTDITTGLLLLFLLVQPASRLVLIFVFSCSLYLLCSCAAGCCLIPFCSDKFKSINHHCPKCRTKIVTIKRL